MMTSFSAGKFWLLAAVVFTSSFGQAAKIPKRPQNFIAQHNAFLDWYGSDDGLWSFMVDEDDVSSRPEEEEEGSEQVHPPAEVTTLDSSDGQPQEQAGSSAPVMPTLPPPPSHPQPVVPASSLHEPPPVFPQAQGPPPSEVPPGVEEPQPATLPPFRPHPATRRPVDPPVTRPDQPRPFYRPGQLQLNWPQRPSGPLPPPPRPIASQEVDQEEPQLSGPRVTAQARPGPRPFPAGQHWHPAPWPPRPSRPLPPPPRPAVNQEVDQEPTSESDKQPQEASQAQQGHRPYPHPTGQHWHPAAPWVQRPARPLPPRPSVDQELDQEPTSESEERQQPELRPGAAQARPGPRPVPRPTGQYWHPAPWPPRPSRPLLPRPTVDQELDQEPATESEETDSSVPEFGAQSSPAGPFPAGQHWHPAAPWPARRPFGNRFSPPPPMPVPDQPADEEGSDDEPEGQERHWPQRPRVRPGSFPHQGRLPPPSFNATAEGPSAEGIPPRPFQRPPPGLWWQRPRPPMPRPANATVPMVGACGTPDLAPNPGLCVNVDVPCPTNDRFRTRAVGFCADGQRKCCSTLPKNVMRLPVATAYPGLKCRVADGRVGHCVRFMRGCPGVQTNGVALCGGFANAQLCCVTG